MTNHLHVDTDIHGMYESMYVFSFFVVEIFITFDHYFAISGMPVFHGHIHTFTHTHTPQIKLFAF